MANAPTPFRQSPEQRKAVKEAARIVGLSCAETMRKAIDFGLPVLVKRLGKKFPTLHGETGIP